MLFEGYAPGDTEQLRCASLSGMAATNLHQEKERKKERVTSKRKGK